MNKYFRRSIVISKWLVIKHNNLWNQKKCKILTRSYFNLLINYFMNHFCIFYRYIHIMYVYWVCIGQKSSYILTPYCMAFVLEIHQCIIIYKRYFEMTLKQTYLTDSMLSYCLKKFVIKSLSTSLTLVYFSFNILFTTSLEVYMARRPYH